MREFGLEPRIQPKAHALNSFGLISHNFLLALIQSFKFYFLATRATIMSFKSFFVCVYLVKRATMGSLPLLQDFRGELAKISILHTAHPHFINNETET